MLPDRVYAVFLQAEKLMLAKLTRCCPYITRPGFVYLATCLPAKALFSEPGLTVGALTSANVRSILKAQRAWSENSRPEGVEMVSPCRRLRV